VAPAHGPRPRPRGVSGIPRVCSQGAPGCLPGPATSALGIIIALIGLAWPWISKLPLGRLPGDLLIERPGFRLFVPFTTMLVISLLITLILMLFRK
jgi:hypothetical protein